MISSEDKRNYLVKGLLILCVAALHPLTQKPEWRLGCYTHYWRNTDIFGTINLGVIQTSMAAMSAFSLPIAAVLTCLEFCSCAASSYGPILQSTYLKGPYFSWARDGRPPDTPPAPPGPDLSPWTAVMNPFGYGWRKNKLCHNPKWGSIPR